LRQPFGVLSVRKDILVNNTNPHKQMKLNSILLLVAITAALAVSCKPRTTEQKVDKAAEEQREADRAMRAAAKAGAEDAIREAERRAEGQKK
jgi:hypothetical protein